MLGDVIRNYRINAGYSRDGFAKLLDVSGPAVTRWEHGTSNPSAKTFAKIARVMGLSVEELYRLSGDRSTPDIPPPTQAQLTDMMHFTKALVELGVVLPDGTIDAQMLDLMKNAAKTLRFFCKLSAKNTSVDNDEEVKHDKTESK